MVHHASRASPELLTSRRWPGCQVTARVSSACLPGGADGVLEQHRDGHRADASRHRRDVRRDTTDALEVDVTDDAVSFGTRRIVNAVDPDVDHDRAFPNHVAGQHLGLAYRGDDDVRALRVEGEILCTAVTHGDRAVSAFPRLDQQCRHRFPDDVAAADDDDFLAARVDAVAHQQLLDTGRRARRKAVLLADEELADVHGMKAVDVLVWRDAPDDGVAVHVLRQGALDENAVDGGIGIQLVDERLEFRLRRRSRKANGLALHPRFDGRLFLRLHIALAGRIFANNHDGESRRYAFRLEFRSLFRDVGPHGLCHRNPIDQRCFNLWPLASGLWPGVSAQSPPPSFLG